MLLTGDVSIAANNCVFRVHRCEDQHHEAQGCEEKFTHVSSQE